MLLVPIQGEQWQGGLSFPTPAIVTARFPTWFPHLPPATLAAVERLYAGGSYTQSRLVMHTLMHYKSFERLLIARIGPSIARHIALEEVVASGGPTVASQITLVELLLAEVNAYTSALGVLSRFELRMQETHLVEASASKAAAQVHDEQG